ncbi:MAG: sugar ABC transporter permease [Spirochaetales bacterium]|nr:sugar ABC transporter permease [Spirochaetales bacterium]
MSNHTNRTLLPYLLVMPTLVFVLVFTVYPTLASLVGSLFQHRLNVPRYREPVFYGLGNYIDLISSNEFRGIVATTLRYVVVVVPLWIVTALFLALWLSRPRFARLRVVLFHPTMLPMVSAATVWLFFLTPDYGLFNTLLARLGYTGPQNWVGNPDRALWAIGIVAFWKDAGFYMIFYLAGVQSLPRDVFEALKIEGAGPIVTFFRFTVPLLRRTTLFVTTIAVIGAFRVIDHVFVMTQGGPSGRSTLLLYHLWQVRFANLNIGQASTITVILVVILLVFTVANFAVSERRSGDA